MSNANQVMPLDATSDLTMGQPRFMKQNTYAPDNIIPAATADDAYNNPPNFAPKKLPKIYKDFVEKNKVKLEDAEIVTEGSEESDDGDEP